MGGLFVYGAKEILNELKDKSGRPDKINEPMKRLENNEVVILGEGFVEEPS